MGKSTIIKTSSNTGSVYYNNQLLFFTYENLINRKIYMSPGFLYPL